MQTSGLEQLRSFFKLGPRSLGPKQISPKAKAEKDILEKILSTDRLQDFTDHDLERIGILIEQLSIVREQKKSIVLKNQEQLQNFVIELKNLLTMVRTARDFSELSEQRGSAALQTQALKTIEAEFSGIKENMRKLQSAQTLSIPTIERIALIAMRSRSPQSRESLFGGINKSVFSFLLVLSSVFALGHRETEIHLDNREPVAESVEEDSTMISSSDDSDEGGLVNNSGTVQQSQFRINQEKETELPQPDMGAPYGPSLGEDLNQPLYMINSSSQDYLPVWRLFTKNFYLNRISYFDGDKHKALKINLVDNRDLADHDKYELCSIKIPNSGYHGGQRISLVMPSHASLSLLDLKFSRPCKHHLENNFLVIDESIADLDIEYSLGSSGLDQQLIPKVQRINSNQATEIFDSEAEVLRANPSLGSIHQYLNKFTYLISNELDEMLSSMPGRIEEKMTYIRFGDCDMLANHIAWLIQSKKIDGYECFVASGFVDSDRDKILIQSNAHALLLFRNQDSVFELETTSFPKASFELVPNEFSMPGERGLRKKDFVVLDQIREEIIAAKTKAERIELMKKFGTTLDTILQDPHYRNFPVSDRGSTSLPIEQYSKQSIDALVLAMLGLYLPGLISIAINGKKKLEPFYSKESMNSKCFWIQHPFKETSRLAKLPYTLLAERAERYRARRVLALINPDLKEIRELDRVGREFLPRLLTIVEGVHPQTLASDGWIDIGLLRKATDRLLELLPGFRPEWDRVISELENLAQESKLSYYELKQALRKYIEKPIDRSELESSLNRSFDEYFQGRESPGPIKREIRRRNQEFESAEGVYTHGDYVIGDDPRRIDWKASMKRDNADGQPHLVVKVPEPVRSQNYRPQTVFVFNVQHALKPNSFELLIRLIESIKAAPQSHRLDRIDIFAYGKVIHSISPQMITAALRGSAYEAAKNLSMTINEIAAQELICSDDPRIQELLDSASRLSALPYQGSRSLIYSSAGEIVDFSNNNYSSARRNRRRQG